MLQLLDRKAFEVVCNKLMHYALENALQELSKTKRLADIKWNELYKDDSFEPSTKCKLGCEFPLRFGLLYKL